MKQQDGTSVVFVNTVIGRGILNGVCNLSFSTFNFTPMDDGSKVDLDPVVSCRLRMDKVCATQLRDVMNDLIAQIEEAEKNAAMGAPDKEKIEGLLPKKAAEKMN